MIKLYKRDYELAGNYGLIGPDALTELLLEL